MHSVLVQGDQHTDLMCRSTFRYVQKTWTENCRCPRLLHTLILNGPRSSVRSAIRVQSKNISQNKSKNIDHDLVAKTYFDICKRTRPCCQAGVTAIIIQPTDRAVRSSHSQQRNDVFRNESKKVKTRTMLSHSTPCYSRSILSQ